MKQKVVIGRVDMVDLPALGIENAKAKIDTGAYTSSIHCSRIIEKDGVLSFFVPVELLGKTAPKKIETRDFVQKRIKSSNGEIQKRYIVKTKIILFNKTYIARFSLSDRSRMKNPILIGRRLLKDRFLVDVSQKNLSFEQKQQRS